MGTLKFWILLNMAVYVAEAQDIVCKKGKLKKTVKIGNGDSFSFKTQAGATYAPNTKCTVTYKRRQASCPMMMFTCSEFNIRNNNPSCRSADKMIIKTGKIKNSYCQQAGPDVTTSAATLKVSFISNKRGQASGAVCTVSCYAGPTTAAPTELTTTAESETTTATGEEPVSMTTEATTTGSAGSRSYLAGLSYSFDSSNSPFCAGSLISSQWVLTTASCSYSDSTKTEVDKVRVVLGEETLGTTDQENFKVVGVAKIIVHPSYSQSSSTGLNNLALWKLSEPVSTSVYSTVCLPAQDTEQAGGATLVGWRISVLVGSLAQTLTQVDTELVSATQCGVSDTILCTSADTTGCQGDLGGPLLQGDNLLIGAVASDKGCSRAGYGIFTRVSKFSSWVETQVASNGGGALCVK